LNLTTSLEEIRRDNPNRSLRNCKVVDLEKNCRRLQENHRKFM